MNKMMAKASVLAVAFIVSLPLGLAAQDEGYYPYSYARLSYVNGAVYIERTAGLGYEKGEVNFALVQGDRIGTESGQAEIHFGRRNYLRLDNNTKVEFAILPREGEERIKIHLMEGSAYLRVSELALEKGVEVHTPDGSFYVLDLGLYRFDVRLGGETRAFVREGSLEAAAEDGSVLVRDQETVTAAGGRLLGDPEYGYAPADAFDDWNGGRDAQLAERSERQYLPSGIAEYEEELDQGGDWVYERPYGNVWVPRVSHYNDWRPYSYGRWAWYHGCGWTWIPSEPWGWTVYHYGRWNWRFGLGWYWIPRSHWGPAWVNWWSDGLYVGWCPLTWYNRPAYLFHDRFYDRYDDHYFSAHNRAMTVVRRDHLQAPGVGRHQVAAGDLDRIGRVELRDRQPAIRPAVDNARPQASAARRALADPSGGRNRVREVAPSDALASSRSRSGASVRSGERGNARGDGDRDVPARPSVRNDGSGGGVVRTYPSGRNSGERGGNGVTEYRRGAVVSPDRSGDSGNRGNEGRVSRPRGQDPGASRTSTVREPQRSQSSGNDRGSSVKSSSSSSSRPSARMSAPASQASRTSPSVSRPSTFSRPSPSSSSRSGSSRGSISSPARSSKASVSRPSSSGSSSSGSTGSSSRSYTAPRSSGSSSSGRSYSAPRSTGSSSGRSVGAPRSGGSSSGGSVRPGGSSTSGRSGSSASKSSGSSSKSGSAKRKD
jgi:hypothetical protein